MKLVTVVGFSIITTMGAIPVALVGGSLPETIAGGIGANITTLVVYAAMKQGAKDGER